MKGHSNPMVNGAYRVLSDSPDRFGGSSRGLVRTSSRTGCYHHDESSSEMPSFENATGCQLRFVATAVPPHWEIVLPRCEMRGSLGYCRSQPSGAGGVLSDEYARLPIGERTWRFWDGGIGDDLDDLADGWAVGFDFNTAKEYYYDSTGQTSWEKPRRTRVVCPWQDLAMTLTPLPTQQAMEAQVLQHHQRLMQAHAMAAEALERELAARNATPEEQDEAIAQRQREHQENEQQSVAQMQAALSADAEQLLKEAEDIAAAQSTIGKIGTAVCVEASGRSIVLEREHASTIVHSRVDERPGGNRKEARQLRGRIERREFRQVGEYLRFPVFCDEHGLYLYRNIARGTWQLGSNFSPDSASCSSEVSTQGTVPLGVELWKPVQWDSTTETWVEGSELIVTTMTFRDNRVVHVREDEPFW